MFHCLDGMKTIPQEKCLIMLILQKYNTHIIYSATQRHANIVNAF